MTQTPDITPEAVERLAKMLTSPPISMSGYGDDVAKCADAMLALSTRLAEVEAERDQLTMMYKMADLAWDQEKERAEAAEARVKELEAKLASLEAAWVCRDLTIDDFRCLHPSQN